jgi:hypothetical protein
MGWKTSVHKERIRFLALLKKNYTPEGFPLDYYVERARIADEIMEGYLTYHSSLQIDKENKKD